MLPLSVSVSTSSESVDVAVAVEVVWEAAAFLTCLDRVGARVELLTVL